MTCHFAAIMVSLSVEAMVRVYKDVWATVVGEKLPCQREDSNRADSFAVAMVRGEAIVGHVPGSKYQFAPCI